MSRGNRDTALPPVAPGTYGRVPMLRALPDGTVNVSVWNKLYRRELWEGIRFLEGHVFEDCEATYKIMNQIGKAVVIGDAVSVQGAAGKHHLDGFLAQYLRSDPPRFPDGCIYPGKSFGLFYG